MPPKEAFKFTGEDAEYYDQYLGPILFEPYAKYLVSQIDTTNVSSVLEIACGTGRVTRHLRKSLPASVKLLATDISNDMLAVAKREVDNTSIEFRAEDAQNLSFADNSFDLVVCQFGMMFLPDKAKGFSEIYRVLKPGGKFLTLTWDDTLNIPLCKLAVNDLVLPHFPDEDTTRFFVPFAMHDPQKLEDLMRNAGFDNVEVKNVTLQSGPHEKADVVNAFLRKHMLGKELRAKDEQAFEPAAKKFEEEIPKRFGSHAPTFDLSAFLTVGIKQ
jgi:ubiquinone/menaquinone biosynthesis C-methylase UbiE